MTDTRTPGPDGPPGQHARDPRVVDTTGPVVPVAVAAPHDPLRLCIFATVAAIAWLAGPVALVFFALLGVRGYVRAIRSGLTSTRCLWHDPRISVAYLAALALLGVAAIGLGIGPWSIGGLS